MPHLNFRAKMSSVQSNEDFLAHENSSRFHFKNTRSSLRSQCCKMRHFVLFANTVTSCLTFELL